MTTILWKPAVFLAVSYDVAKSYVESQYDPPGEIVVLKIPLESLDSRYFGYDWNNRCEYRRDINSVIYEKDICPGNLHVCSGDEPFQDINSFKGTDFYENIVAVFEEEVESNMES